MLMAQGTVATDDGRAAGAAWHRGELQASG
jgi:hypothetical protein